MEERAKEKGRIRDGTNLVEEPGSDGEDVDVRVLFDEHNLLLLLLATKQGRETAQIKDLSVHRAFLYGNLVEGWTHLVFNPPKNEPPCATVDTSSTSAVSIPGFLLRRG